MKTGLASAGSMAAAVLAHLPCCGLNIALALGSFGSGASFLSALEPYRPWLTAFSIVMAGLTVWFAFRPHRTCAHSECHHNDRRNQLVRKGAALAVALLALGSPFIAPAGHDHSHGQDVVLHD